VNGAGLCAAIRSVRNRIIEAIFEFIRIGDGDPACRAADGSHRAKFENVVPRLYTAFLISLLVFNLFGAQLLDAQQPATTAPPKLHIDVVEGDAQLINIKSHINPAPVVQVLDENNKPVQGALVVFFLPSQGPGGTFASGANNSTVTTDRNGRAAAAGIAPNSQTGVWEIRVSASYQGQTASAVITQTNVSGISVSGTGGGISKKAVIILALVGGAIAGGVIAARAAAGGGSSSGNKGIIITAGTATVGAPQ
jgi:hypothetical protein